MNDKPIKLEKGRYKAWSAWIEETKLTGGVSDNPQDRVDALRAAYDFCFSVHFENGNEHNEMAQLGFKWVASYMVSCVLHDADNLLAIFSPSPDRQAAFQAEASRNIGLVQTNLQEAADINQRLFESAMAATFATLMVAPTGKGKSWGYIQE